MSPGIRRRFGQPRQTAQTGQTGQTGLLNQANGFALVAVLWVTAMLSAMAMGYATTARLQGQEALHGLHAAQGSYLLQSALAKGEHELRRYQRNRHLLARKDELETVGQSKLNLWWPRHEPYRMRMEGRGLAVSLVAATGKLDVNSLDYARWVTILTACGLSDSAEITSVANSVADWIDTDSNFGIGGAENEHYLSLDKPYLCKDGPLESIEELLLIKGITPELYHGSEERPGLADLLDVGGSRNKLDINSASPRALLMVQGLTPEMAQAVSELRQAGPIQDLADLNAVLPSEVLDLLRQDFDILPLGTVYLEAARVLPDGRLGTAIRQASSS